jgi:hypothetical protein
MPAPINVELRGYLDFFRLKNGGRNPQITGEVLQPTMDMQRWYLESQANDYNITFANITGANDDADFIPITATSPTNLANGSQLQVPQTEIWIVMPGSSVTATGNSVANQRVKLGLVSIARIAPPNQPLNLPMVEQGWSTFDATILFTASWILEEPIWLRSGSFLLVRNYGATVGGSTIFSSGVLRLVRLRV